MLILQGYLVLVLMCRCCSVNVAGAGAETNNSALVSPTWAFFTWKDDED